MTEEKTALVKSPSRPHHFREGKGFSLMEIEKAGLRIQDLKQMKLPIDYFRRSSHERNVEVLLKLEIPKKSKEKKAPFVKKEKKKAEFKPRKAKLEKEIKEKEIKEKEIKEKAPKKEVKEKTPKKERVKKESIPEKTIVSTVIPLTELHGLGPKTAEKLKALGVTSVNDLIREDPAELGALITGTSESSIKDWIEEGKELLKE